MLTDTHAHLFWDSFKSDFDQVIQDCLDQGITTIINVGTDPQTSKQATLLQSTNPQVKFYSTIGIHPHEATNYWVKDQLSRAKLEKDIKILEKVYNSNPKKVVAIGECGLDYFINPEYLPNNLTTKQYINLQKLLFQSQINLAKKLNLPLVIHCRDDRSKNPQTGDAWQDCLKMLKDSKCIFHCYSGLLHNTNYILQNDSYLFSFSATLTYPKNDHLIEAVKIIPLEKIVPETDCPFLPPQERRGQRNDPTTVKQIAQKIAAIKNLSFEEVAHQTTQNTINFLKLST